MTCKFRTPESIENESSLYYASWIWRTFPEQPHCTKSQHVSIQRYINIKRTFLEPISRYIDGLLYCGINYMLSMLYCAYSSGSVPGARGMLEYSPHRVSCMSQEATDAGPGWGSLLLGLAFLPLTYFPFSFPLTSCPPSFTFFYFSEWWADSLSKWGLMSCTFHSHFCLSLVLYLYCWGWHWAGNLLVLLYLYSPTCGTCPVIMLGTCAMATPVLCCGPGWCADVTKAF